MKKLVVQSFAKINICLDITGLREDGYHLLDTVMLPISLHDTLLITETPRAIDNYITLDEFTIGDSQYNTVTQAINFLDEKYKLNTKFKIDLHKVIPMKAGLGGGSSNAAFTLKAIDSYKKLNATEEEIHNAAVKIGADVAFFVKNKPARCRGIGDIIEPITIKNDYLVYIVKPEKGCPTKDVFAISDKKRNWPHGNVDTVVKALEEGDDNLLSESIFNVLEESSFELVPEIKTIKNELKAIGFKIVLMSGSGSSVFALTTDKKLIKAANKKMENKYYTATARVLK